MFFWNLGVGFPVEKHFPHFFCLNCRRPTMAFVLAINNTTISKTNHTTAYSLLLRSTWDYFRIIRRHSRESVCFAPLKPLFRRNLRFVWFQTTMMSTNYQEGDTILVKPKRRKGRKHSEGGRKKETSYQTHMEDRENWIVEERDSGKLQS